MGYAPIALFVYCRPEHAQSTVEALLLNKESNETDLYIFSDAPKNEKAVAGVKATRKYIHSITGFKTVNIYEREKNWGLAKSLIDGITKIVNEYGRIIIVEDDIEVSPYFLKYMNDALEMYADDEKVASIHGYVYPHTEKLPDTFFIRGADCWGWATWKRAWDVFSFDASALKNEIVKRRLQKQFNFDYTYDYLGLLQKQIDGKVSSWAICWYASTFLMGMYTLYPNIPMANQTGNDGGPGATHSNDNKEFETVVNCEPLTLNRIEICESPDGYRMFSEFHKRLNSGIKFRLKMFLKKLYNSTNLICK